MPHEETDLRTKLAQELQQFALTHPEQKEAADKMLRFLDEHEDAFERSCQAGHFTGSAWLVSPDGTKALLTLHHKLGRWMQTGGHADGCALPIQVALKEATEESGIEGIQPLSTAIFDIDIHPIPANPLKGESEHLHYDLRYLLQAPHMNYIISAESDDLAWWEKKDFAEHAGILDASVLRMAERFFHSIPNTTAPSITTKK